MSATKYLRFGVSLVTATIVFLIVYSGNLNQVHAFQIESQPARTGNSLIHSIQGADLFSAYCASCHGVSGTGNGPASPALKKHVPDLTRIAQRNGGFFPEERVRKIIAGDASITSHGSRLMPVWGPVFHQVEQDQDWGNVRLENLVKYLKSIQIEPIRRK